MYDYKQVVIALIVGWLATTGSASLFGSSTESRSRFFHPKHDSLEGRANFKALNWYLVGKVPSDNYELNVARIQADLDKMTGGTRRAAEMVLELVNLKPGQCNDNILKIIGHLDMDGVKSYGDKRIEKVIRPYLSDALKACTSYIESTIEQRFFGDQELASTLTNMAQTSATVMALSNVSPAKRKRRALFGPMDKRYKYYPLDEAMFADVLSRLAALDPQAEFTVGTTKVVKRRDNFDYALNKYLEEPCRQVTSIFGDLFEAAAWLASVQRVDTDDLYEYVEARSVMFQGLAWMSKDCKSLLHLSESKKAAMFKECVENDKHY